MGDMIKILIVEDNVGDFMLVEEYLKEVYELLEIDHCWRISEAINYLNNKIYDIVLLDLTLPDSNGQLSVQEIVEQSKSAPVIVLTGYADKNFAIETMHLGVQDYLIKDEVNATILLKSISYSIERNNIQQQVLKNEKRFRSIVENSTDGFALIGPDGSIRDLSPYGKAVIDFNPKDDSVLFRAELLHPRHRKMVVQSFLEILEHPGAMKRLEFKYKSSEDEYRWIESTLHNLLKDPSVEAVVLNYRDITARKLEEEERKNLINELLQSNADLKQFSYITTHNLRAPVTNLLSIVELLDLDKITDQQTKELFDAFKFSAFQLNDTLTDLMKILFIRQNKNIELKEVDFESVVNKSIQELSSQIAHADIMIHTDFSEAPSVLFDQNYLENIVINLLSNAIKFADANRTLEVNIVTKNENENTIFEFSDNGIGMDMARVKDRIFGLYQRFHDRSDSKGIGLYLVHTQVTALGAKISVESKVNEGTKFVITFKHSDSILDNY